MKREVFETHADLLVQTGERLTEVVAALVVEASRTDLQAWGSSPTGYSRARTAVGVLVADLLALAGEAREMARHLASTQEDSSPSIN